MFTNIFGRKSLVLVLGDGDVWLKCGAFVRGLAVHEGRWFGGTQAPTLTLTFAQGTGHGYGGMLERV